MLEEQDGLGYLNLNKLRESCSNPKCYLGVILVGVLNTIIPTSYFPNLIDSI